MVPVIVGLLAGPLGLCAAVPDGQYVRDWLVAGPVAAEVTTITNVVAVLPKSVLPVPEDGRSLRLTSGQQLTWNRYLAPGSMVNLVHALGRQEQVCGLAYTTIRADRAGPARFVMGSDDQLAIVLNRRIVYRCDEERPLSPDQDTFTAPLEAGENECLAVVGQGGGNWGFTLRVLTGEESRPPPLIWDAVDVLEQSRELYSPHWRHAAGDAAAFARPDYDDSRWKPLDPNGEAVGVQDAPVVWFRCPVWVRPSLVNLPCSMKARYHGRVEVYADGVRVATLGDTQHAPADADKNDRYTPPARFSFTAPQQVLAVRLERPAEAVGRDRLDLRLSLSMMTRAPVNGAPIDARPITPGSRAGALESGAIPRDYRVVMSLWMHRLVIMAILVLFLVFHVALLYYYPRRRGNREFCLTLAMALVAMLVLHAQEASNQPPNGVLYRTFLALSQVCLLSGLVLVHALWCDRIRRGQLVAWTLLAAVLYGAAWVRDEPNFVRAFAPLVTLEYCRIYLLQAVGKVKGWPVYGVGAACFAAAQTLFILYYLFPGLIPEALAVPYFWVYGFVAFMASVSVEIGREFAGAVRKLEDLTATLDARVQEVTRQLETRLLAQARLETLRYQLNPHFLYNALNSIEALSRDGPAQIPELVRRLCECLRYALHPKKGGLTTLQEELQHVASYLHVEQVRFGDHLLVETDVHDAAHEAIVPEFLLQPLIENAVKYGMRTSDMPLRLVLRAGCTDGMLEIEVRNTGRWAGDAGDAKSGGIGLENLRNRLELLYAGRQRVTTAEEAGWVSVTVAIPFKTDEAGIVSSPR
jgi:hypothetical protein